MQVSMKVALKVYIGFDWECNFLVVDFNQNPILSPKVKEVILVFSIFTISLVSLMETWWKVCNTQKPKTLYKGTTLRSLCSVSPPLVSCLLSVWIFVKIRIISDWFGWCLNRIIRLFSPAIELKSFDSNELNYGSGLEFSANTSKKISKSTYSSLQGITETLEVYCTNSNL